MRRGRGEIRVPLAVDDNGRDYSARIEAQVIDASSREVSGNTVVHATHGPFLLSAQVAGYLFRPGQPVSATVRALDYAGTPQVQRACDLGAGARHVSRRLLPGTHANRSWSNRGHDCGGRHRDCDVERASDGRLLSGARQRDRR